MNVNFKIQSHWLPSRKRARVFFSVFQPSRLTLVPPIMVLLAKHPKVSEYDLSCVKTISCGAAPLSNEIEQAVVKRMNLSNILQGKPLQS